MLSSGLNNVPKLDTSHEKLHNELEKEAILICKNAFFSYFGYYPTISTEASLNQSIIQILSHCKSNTELVAKLSKFRDDFVNSLPLFLKTIRKSGINLKKILNSIPEDCIISPSDKNLGVSPPVWFEKEYNSQIIKGGHEKVELSEFQCLRLLESKIRDFRSILSQNQQMILRNHWPKNTLVHRIGVLKLVPKVRNSIIKLMKRSFFYRFINLLAP